MTTKHTFKAQLICEIRKEEIMTGASHCLIFVLMACLMLSGCTRKEDQTRKADQTNAQPESVSTPTVLKTTAVASGFDISQVPVVSPQLGKFPYFSLVEGYQPGTSSDNKEVAFDRYEFFDGTKINTVEGRLTTIEAEGHLASAYEVFKTYESLITELGGVKVFEGTAEKMDAVDAKFSDMRHRQPVYGGDQMGVYLLRTPEKDIWVEAYVRSHGKEGNYFLTVVETKALDVKAQLLPAEEMKKELDAKGHVALYINFDFDKADIKPDSQPIIDQIVKLLKNNPDLNLTVEGHTDNVGQAPYNKKLSEARARSVVGALAAQGIEVRRLKAVGYGPDKPIADNSTDSGRVQNRRVELVKV